MELNYAVVGAVIGAETGNPFSAFFLSIIGHFIIDKIPHFWPKTQKAKTFYVSFGYLITGLFLLLIFRSSYHAKTIMLIGAITSVGIDTIIIGVPFIHKSKLCLWHTSRQPHKDKPIFI